eukprot:7764570-Alexandrium_andersonii.AAC.1
MVAAATRTLAGRCCEGLDQGPMSGWSRASIAAWMPSSFASGPRPGATARAISTARSCARTWSP